MDHDSKIFISGGHGMVGKALVKELSHRGYTTLLTPTSKELDLRHKEEVFAFFKKNEPDYVFHLAAKVGGIAANIQFPVEHLYDNLEMQNNVLEASRQNSIKRLLFLGSSCMYPRESKQPMKEDYLLDGKLEPTNEGYALAKISGMKLCQYYNQQYGTDFICLVPCNLYGPNDHFELERSHVISALIAKFHNAKINNKPFVEVWGTGRARREFLYVGDLADALIYFMKYPKSQDLFPFVNIGLGEDISIFDLAHLIKTVVNYAGDIRVDSTRPEGMARKLLDINKAKALGWSPATSLASGLKETFKWYHNVEHTHGS